MNLEKKEKLDMCVFDIKVAIESDKILSKMNFKIFEKGTVSKYLELVLKTGIIYDMEDIIYISMSFDSDFAKTLSDAVKFHGLAYLSRKNNCSDTSINGVDWDDY